MLGISPETVRLHLLRIGYTLTALHWVSHILMDDLKPIRVEMRQKMLAALQGQGAQPMAEHCDWRRELVLF
jgi:hypothetical protein